MKAAGGRVGGVVNGFMGFMKKFVWALIVFGLVALVIANYSFIFSKTITGRIETVARVTEFTAIVGARDLTDRQLHSYAMSIRQADGELLTASGDDSKWEAVKPGVCVQARFYPYPPWDLTKTGTYMNARLIRQADCGSPAARDMGIDPSAFPAAVSAPSSAEPVATPSSVIQQEPAHNE